MCCGDDAFDAVDVAIAQKIARLEAECAALRAGRVRVWRWVIRIVWWGVIVPLGICAWLFFAWVGYLIVRFDAYAGLP